MKKLLIGITMGDPCGIGAEIIVKAVSSPQLCEAVHFLIIGSEDVLSRAAEMLKIPFDYEMFDDAVTTNLRHPQLDTLKLQSQVCNPQSAIYNSRTSLLGMKNFVSDGVAEGKPTAEGGRAAVEYIFKGIDLAMNGIIDGLVTAPINKEAIAKGGFDYPGHTELLKERTNSEKAVMLMVGANLRVSFVTSHIPLKKVPESIKSEDVASTIMITAQGLKRYFCIDQPRVAVCGLNPHSGEGGRFGLEEIETIIPAIKMARDNGVDCVGPVPPDVVFYKAVKGEFDVVVALYHDQGAIPLKLLAFESGVNITLGIPIIRTSPDHGTAYDIAWRKGIANPGSLIEAIKVAIMMAERKKNGKRGQATAPLGLCIW